MEKFTYEVEKIEKGKLDLNTDKNLSFKASTENIIEETPEDANITNCLALTVKKDYKLVLFSNALKKGTRMTFKVILSTFVINVLNLFL